MVRCQINGQKQEVDKMVERLKLQFHNLDITGEFVNPSTLHTRKFIAINLNQSKQ